MLCAKLVKLEQEDGQARIVADEFTAVEGEFLWRRRERNFRKQGMGICRAAVDAPFAGNVYPSGSRLMGNAGNCFSRNRLTAGVADKGHGMFEAVGTGLEEQGKYSSSKGLHRKWRNKFIASFFPAAQFPRVLPRHVFIPMFLFMLLLFGGVCAPRLAKDLRLFCGNRCRGAMCCEELIATQQLGDGEFHEGEWARENSEM